MWNWFYQLSERRKVQASSSSSPASWLVDWVRGGTESDSGVTVNGSTALTYAPLWYAVNRIGGHVGQLPCVIYEQRGEREKTPARQHPAYNLVKKRPNNLMTAFTFRETLQSHALLWGNGRAGIIRNNRNDPTELIPLLPDRWETLLVNGEKWHVRRSRETEELLPNERFRDRDVLHVPGLGFDGLVGYSVITLARNSWGLGLAAEKHTNRHFKNNAKPGLVLEAPPGVLRDEKEARKFIADWNSWHGGLDNVDKAGLLREGVKATPLSMSGKDAQWLEQRQFQRQEAALWMLLEQILGDDSSVSYNSLEQKMLAYLTNCLMRWLVKWEQEIEQKLLTTQQRMSESHFCKFTTAGLLRGSTKERYEVYQIGRQIGVLSANDVRSLEDMNPIDGGDDYSNPAITPGSPGDEPPSDNDDPATAIAARRMMIEDKLRPVVTHEINRVDEAAKTASNFLSWVDKFYGGGFADRLAEVYQAIGADAADHIEQSRADLLQATESSSEEFLTTIDALMSQWRQRPQQIAEALTTELEAVA